MPGYRVETRLLSAFFSVAMLCEFAVQHCNQGLTFSCWLDTGFAHDIGCGQRLAVQAVVRIIVWFHRCTSQGYASEQPLGLPVSQNLGVRRTSGARKDGLCMSTWPIQA
jgi:hypothetical protein